MRREEAQFGRKPAASLVRCSCLHAREVSADVRLQGTKIVPGFTVAWLPPGQGQRGPPAELPGWWDRVVLSGQLPGSGCLRLLGNHVHELLAQDRRGNCREERALLGCPGLVPEGQGCTGRGLTQPCCLSPEVVREARNSRVGIRPQASCWWGMACAPGYLLGLLLEGGGDGQGS